MATTLPYMDAIKRYTAAKLESPTALARRAGLPRSTLYTILDGTYDPSIGRVERLLGAIGYRLVAEPVPDAEGAGGVSPAVPGVPPAVLQACAEAGYEIRHMAPASQATSCVAAAPSSS